MPTPSSRIYRVCQHCSKEFSVLPSTLKHSSCIFCSNACRLAKQSIDRTAKSVASMVPRVCTHCSKIYDVLPWEIKLGRKVFCSRKCDNASRAEKKSHPEFRFWKYVNKTEGCWFWTGGLTKGYGQTNVPKHTYAHRFSWQIHKGPIPAGQCVLHHCDTPRCVRPDHLFLGTDGDNTRDRIKKGRGHIRLITAFGETKTMAEWLRDTRCLGTYASITQRLERGFSPEFALKSRPLTQFEAGLCVMISRSLKRDDGELNLSLAKFAINCYSSSANDNSPKTSARPL